MTLTAILSFFAFFGALGFLVAIIVCIYAATEPKSYYHCCGGRCNGEIDCPAKTKEQRND